LSKYYQNEEDEVDMRDPREGSELYTKFSSNNLKGKDLLEDPSSYRRIILKSS
jgi:hypothetical protein